MSQKGCFGFSTNYALSFIVITSLMLASALQAQVLSPNYVEAQRVLALARSENGTNKQAQWRNVINAAEIIVKLEPQHPEANAWIAEAYENLDLNNQAWKYWQKTWLETNDPEAFSKAMDLANNLAQVSIDATLLNDAEIYYLSMFEMDATDPRAYRGLAYIASKRGLSQDAERYWRTVLKLEPNNLEALAAVTEVAQINTVEAAEASEPKQVEPVTPVPQAETATPEGVTDQAIVTQIIPTQAPPEPSLETRYNPAAVIAYKDGLRLYDAGEAYQARLLFISAIEQDDSFKEAWVWLGKTRFEQESYTLAAQAFQRALDLYPNDGNVRASLNQAIANQ